MNGPVQMSSNVQTFEDTEEIKKNTQQEVCCLFGTALFINCKTLCKFKKKSVFLQLLVKRKRNMTQNKKRNDSMF